MRTFVILLVVGVLGCKGKQKEAAQGTSGAGSDSEPPAAGDPPATGDPDPAPVKELTDAEQAKRYRECLELSNKPASPAYRACFAERVTFYSTGQQGWIGLDEEIAEADKRRAVPGYRRDPQLIIAGDHHVFAILLISGPKPALAAHHIELDGAWKVTTDAVYLARNPERPAATPWPEKLELLTPGDDVSSNPEAATAAFAVARVHKGLQDAIEKKDAKSLGKVLADDFVWSEQSAPADLDKAGFIEMQQERWKDAKKLRHDVPIMWLSGDYLALIESTIVTDKDGKESSKKRVGFYRKSGDQLKHAWVFE
jgi:hypothetical protein